MSHDLSITPSFCVGENPPFDRFQRVGHGKVRQLTAPLQSLSSTARFLAKLRPFLRHPYSAEECRAAAVRQLPARTANLRRIRSYGKLTSEGMTFLGTDLLSLVEEVLPARFGGSPTDYQFVEEEEGGLSRISILVSPSVGAVDEAAVVDAVLEFLAARRIRMAERWRAGQTLRVVRREPYRTGTAKILPLHIQRSDRP